MSLAICLQLKLHAAQQTITIKVDGTYSAKAYDATDQSELKQLFDSDRNPSITVIIICTCVFLFILALFIVGILTVFFLSSMCAKYTDKFLDEKKFPLIFSLAVISPIICLYTFILSSCALGYWDKTYKNDMLYKLDTRHIVGPTSTIFAINLILMPSCLVYLIIVLLCFLCRETKHCFVALSLTVFFPIFSVIAHTPFIAIAYLNDGYHAGSIFIYYTVVLFMAYSICWISYKSFDQLKSSNKDCLAWCVLSLLTILIVLFLFFVILISAYFVIIPINKSISDAPNRLVGLYQSGGFLIGSFIVYKLINFFYKSDVLKEALIAQKHALPNAQENWNNLTSEEKVQKFYELVIGLAKKQHERNNSRN